MRLGISRKREGGMAADDVPAHQCTPLFYLHPPFKVISSSLFLSLRPVLLLFSLYFPYQSILIIGPPAPHLRLPLAFPPLPPPLCPAEGQRKRRRAEGRNARKTQRHTMKPFICPIKETEAQRKVNIHLSLSPSFSVCLSFLAKGP